MNIKIAKTLLILSLVYMIAFYIIKFIFPEVLLLQITDPNVLSFGNFIESWEGYTHIYYCLSTFLTFYLFCCASCVRFKFKWYEFMYMLGAVVLSRIVATFLPSLYVHYSTSIMFILAMLCKGKLTRATITFTIHGFLSQFLFSIRGYETIVGKINIASCIALSIECYMWLLVLSLLFYLKEKKNGSSTTIPKQDGV